MHVQKGLDSVDVVGDELATRIELLRGHVMDVDIGSSSYIHRSDPSSECPGTNDRHCPLPDTRRKGVRHARLHPQSTVAYVRGSLTLKGHDVADTEWIKQDRRGSDPMRTYPRDGTNVPVVVRPESA